jgi:glutaredoxin
MDEYKVYVKDNCPYCERVKKLLDVCKLNYTLYNVSDPGIREEFDKHFNSVTSVPQVSVNGTPIGDSIEFVSHLKERKLI